MGPLIGSTPVPLAQVISSNGGVAMQTPVSTTTPLSTTARPPSIDRVGSIDSQHSQHSVSSPQALEWAVPHQTKLKYTQLFNTWDRTRSGFLSGPQARNIMVQSQLSQVILAQIWYVHDNNDEFRSFFFIPLFNSFLTPQLLWSLATGRTIFTFSGRGTTLGISDNAETSIALQNFLPARLQHRDSNPRTLITLFSMLGTKSKYSGFPEPVRGFLALDLLVLGVSPIWTRMVVWAAKSSF